LHAAVARRSRRPLSLGVWPVAGASASRILHPFAMMC
jgi:hypothetical protein